MTTERTEYTELKRMSSSGQSAAALHPCIPCNPWLKNLELNLTSTEPGAAWALTRQGVRM